MTNPELVQPSPAEGAVALIECTYGLPHGSEAMAKRFHTTTGLPHGSEAMAKRFHTTTWSRWFRPEVNVAEEAILNDPARTKLLMESIDQALVANAPANYRYIAQRQELMTALQREILQLRYWLIEGPRTQRAISEHLHLHQHTIRVNEARALQKLRHPSRSRFLLAFKNELQAEIND